MPKIIKPYVCDCLVGGKWEYKLRVVDENAKSVWVQLEDGRIIKRNKTKHKAKIRFMVVTPPPRERNDD